MESATAGTSPVPCLGCRCDGWGWAATVCAQGSPREAGDVDPDVELLSQRQPCWLCEKSKTLCVSCSRRVFHHLQPGGLLTSTPVRVTGLLSATCGSHGRVPPCFPPGCPFSSAPCPSSCRRNSEPEGRFLRSPRLSPTDRPTALSNMGEPGSLIHRLYSRAPGQGKPGLRGAVSRQSVGRHWPWQVTGTWKAGAFAALGTQAGRLGG